MIQNDKHLMELIDRGWTLTLALKSIEKELKELKKALKPYFDVLGRNQIESDQARALRSITQEWIIEQLFVEEIRKVVGDLFDEFVVTDIRYKPTSKMKDLLVNADDTMASQLRPFIRVRETEKIFFRPLKVQTKERNDGQNEPRL